MTNENNTLQFLLNRQSELQTKMPSPHPTELFHRYHAGVGIKYTMEESTEAREEAINFIHWNVTALVDELHELLAEIGWKPWAKSKHINLDAARGELIDALHFLMNLALVLGLTQEDITKLYLAKHEKNAKRQAEGYDGVSTKCPGCKRALDDAAVDCRVTEARLGTHQEIPVIWCSVRGRTFAIKDAEV